MSNEKLLLLTEHELRYLNLGVYMRNSEQNPQKVNDLISYQLEILAARAVDSQIIQTERTPLNLINKIAHPIHGYNPHSLEHTSVMFNYCSFNSIPQAAVAAFNPSKKEELLSLYFKRD